MTLQYWYDERGEVRCENRHGLVFTLPGAPPAWRPRLTATPIVPAAGRLTDGWRPAQAGRA